MLALSLVAGMIVGYFLRRKPFNVGRLIFGVILVLIFSLGFSIGSNDELLEVMPSVGLTAVVLLAMVLLFSVLYTKAAVKLVKL